MKSLTVEAFATTSSGVSRRRQRKQWVKPCTMSESGSISTTPGDRVPSLLCWRRRALARAGTVMEEKGAATPDAREWRGQTGNATDWLITASASRLPKLWRNLGEFSPWGNSLKMAAGEVSLPMRNTKRLAPSLFSSPASPFGGTDNGGVCAGRCHVGERSVMPRI